MAIEMLDMLKAPGGSWELAPGIVLSPNEERIYNNHPIIPFCPVCNSEKIELSMGNLYYGTYTLDCWYCNDCDASMSWMVLFVGSEGSSAWTNIEEGGE